MKKELKEHEKCKDKLKEFTVRIEKYESTKVSYEMNLKKVQTDSYARVVELEKSDAALRKRI